MIAEEKDLVLLPEALTYGGGAQVACGYYFGCRVETGIVAPSAESAIDLR
jgi:hypothetical protein